MGKQSDITLIVVNIGNAFDLFTIFWPKFIGFIALNPKLKLILSPILTAGQKFCPIFKLKISFKTKILSLF